MQIPGIADFDGAQFCGVSTFHRAQFAGDLWFRQVQCSRRAAFHKARRTTDGRV
ncbi:pentapeptide repeat-containing protein [Streptomyces massasporeus]